MAYMLHLIERVLIVTYVKNHSPVTAVFPFSSNCWVALAIALAAASRASELGLRLSRSSDGFEGELAVTAINCPIAWSTSLLALAASPGGAGEPFSKKVRT